MLKLNPTLMLLVVPRLQEEGSWDEDGQGGGILPRAFDAWGWSIEELAAFTAVRQLLLVPDRDFNAVWKPPPTMARCFCSDLCVGRHTAETLQYVLSLPSVRSSQGS